MSKKELTAPSKSERDYEAESAADTLLRAHEIKCDDDMMKRVKKHAGRKLKALTGLKDDIRSIDDIKKAKNEKFGPKKKSKMDSMFDEEDEE